MTNTNTEKEKYRIQGVGVWEIAHGSMLGKPSPEEWTLNHSQLRGDQGEDCFRHGEEHFQKWWDLAVVPNIAGMKRI